VFVFVFALKHGSCCQAYNVVLSFHGMLPWH
jgi:hypothetical protein